MPHSLADPCRDKPKNRHSETKLNQTPTSPPLSTKSGGLSPRSVPHGHAGAPLEASSEARSLAPRWTCWHGNDFGAGRRDRSDGGAREESEMDGRGRSRRQPWHPTPLATEGEHTGPALDLGRRRAKRIPETAPCGCEGLSQICRQPFRFLLLTTQTASRPSQSPRTRTPPSQNRTRPTNFL